MLRGLILFLGLLAAAPAAIWPDQIGTFTKTETRPMPRAGLPVWDEYGLEQGEQAEYRQENQRFIATAYRLKDSTAAFAVYQWQRPASAKPSKLGSLAVESDGGALLAFGNYVLRFDGRVPKTEELAPMLGRLPKLDQSPLPTLTGYLPATNLVENSERYVIGPVSLEEFEARIPPSVAAFHTGAEAQLGTYRAPGGELKLAVFSYPTPHIARERVAEFQKLPGAMAKRSGPLVAVIVSPADRDAAERLLGQVNYRAALTLNEYVPTRRDNIGNLIINIFILTGFLLVFAAVAGLAVGGLRVWTQRRSGSQDTMVLLHLSDW